MNRLYTILAELQLKEKLLKLQGKEMKKRLWRDLMVKHKNKYLANAMNNSIIAVSVLCLWNSYILHTYIYIYDYSFLFIYL